MKLLSPRQPAIPAPFAAILLTLLLGACATRGPAPADAAVIREFTARGYAVHASSAGVVASRHTWVIEGQAVKIVLAAPQRAGRSPVVIYLPGLGEASDAGERWRNTWAAAGYAVISVQLLEEDAKAWGSDLALDADFKALGRHHYAAVAVHRRMHILKAVILEAARRADAGEAAWQSIDSARIAIAGFDLGAYTAMAVAGERIPGAQINGAPDGIRAVIVLSPYVNLADGTVATRYADIRAPVLSVTSDGDRDSLGLVETPSTRFLPFDRMPGPNKFLLSVQGVRHSGLGGAIHAANERSNAGVEPTAATEGPGKPGSGAGAPRQRGAGRTESGQSGHPGRGRPAAPGDASVPRVSATELELSIVAAQTISVAFLDAYVHDNPGAREWLNSEARAWLGSRAELRIK